MRIPRIRRDRPIEAVTDGDTAGSPSPGWHADEGLLIASTALRLSAKNRLIVRALRDGEAFDEEWYVAALRSDIDALLVERLSDEERLEEMRASARRRLGRADHGRQEHPDLQALLLRQRMDRELTDRLRRLRNDDDFARKMLAAARDAALDEILAAFQTRRAELFSGFLRDDRYVAERSDRLDLVRRDLQGLQRARSW